MTEPHRNDDALHEGQAWVVQEQQSPVRTSYQQSTRESS